MLCAPKTTNPALINIAQETLGFRRTGFFGVVTPKKPRQNAAHERTTAAVETALWWKWGLTMPNIKFLGQIVYNSRFLGILQ